MSGNPFRGANYMRAPRELDTKPHGWKRINTIDLTDVEHVRRLSQAGIAKTVACMDCGADAGSSCVTANGNRSEPHRARNHQGARYVRELIALLEATP